jgi:hypothetical protein
LVWNWLLHGLKQRALINHNQFWPTAVFPARVHTPDWSSNVNWLARGRIFLIVRISILRLQAGTGFSFAP